MTDDKVLMTTTYYRDESGEARIRITCGTVILSDEPNPYFFVDADQMTPWIEIDTRTWRPYPWEKRMVKQ